MKKLSGMLGEQRIPDPATSGELSRRFGQDSILELMEAIHATRKQGLERATSDFLSQAIIDTDGTRRSDFRRVQRRHGAFL
jgi:hypothetical protein